jgi:hypothetical protein
MRWLSVRVNAVNEGNNFGARSDREAVQDHRRELQAYPEGRRERPWREPLWRVPYSLGKLAIS